MAPRGRGAAWLSEADGQVATQDIDAVVTWVDGCDPTHAASRARHMAAEGLCERAEARARRRWDYAGDLDLCLRSLHRHAPWLRRVFIVTSGQVPPGLDRLPQAFRRKVEVVGHEALFEGYEDWLPTFNSMGIEAMLWRVPGLAERFLYFNDDMLLGHASAPTDFFEGGQTVIRGCWLSFTDAQSRDFAVSVYRAGKINAARAVGYVPGRFFSPAHVATPMRVSTLRALFAARPDLLALNAGSRFRAPDQVLVQSLFVHAALKDGTAREASARDWRNLSSSFCEEASWPRYWLTCRLIGLRKARYRLLCVNDLARLIARFGPDAERRLREAARLTG